MKTNLKIFFTLCCLTMMNISFGETPPTDSSSGTPPSPTVIRADEANSWATLGRLYVIIATNDNDEACGKTAERNSNALVQLFRKHVAQKAVTVLKIPPQNVSRQTLLSLCANLPLREDDAVMFYYSGKGNIDRKYGQFFELSSSKEELYRAEIRSAIQKKNPRLCVIVSDCCDASVAVVNEEETTNKEEAESEDKDEKKPRENTSENTLSSGKKGSSEENVTETLPLFFSLFFISRGTVDISSTTIGQASCANENRLGCFTETFSGLLEVNRNKILSWQRIFPYLQEGTSLVFARSYPNGADIGEGRQQKEQTPVLLHLGNEVVDSPTQLSFYPPNDDSNTDAAVNTEEKRREEDRNVVIQLVQQAVGELRPFDAQDSGTHENQRVLDVDNTMLGLNGKPFSKEIPPITVSSDENISRNTDSEQAAPAPQKIRLGIQAAENKGDGVVITRVVPGFPGQIYGLEVGDVILEINNKKISSEKEYSDAIDTASGRIIIVIRNKKTGRPVTVTINRIQSPSAE